MERVQKREFLPTPQEISQRVLMEEKNPPRSKYTKEERENEADPKLLKRANQLVTKPIPRVMKFNGRPCKYTPTKFRNKANDYFCYCEKNDKIPSMKGLFLYMKMTPGSVANYAKRPEFREIMDHIRMIICDWLESDIYASRGQAAGKLAYMQNLHNWTNKTEETVVNKEMSVEEARAKIEALAPMLIEVFKSNPDMMKLLMPTMIEAQEVTQ